MSASSFRCRSLRGRPRTSPARVSFGSKSPKLIRRVRLLDRHDIEIVNVFREPKRALADGIFMRPTLVKLAPAPAPRRIVGTLSHTQPVLQALKLEAFAE